MLSFRRGAGLSNAEYVGKNCYKWYKKHHDGDDIIGSRKFNEILKEAYSEIVKLMVFENFQFKMPQKLGYLRLKKKPLVMPIKDGNVVTKYISIDWKKTKEYWEKIYPDKTPKEITEIKNKPLIRELNEHTDGYRLRWFWDKHNAVILNKEYYQFRMSRTNKQFLASSLRTVKNLNFYE